jgi:hypothetical protein
MSILGALKQQTESIDDLAKLPQTMIMQMAQKGQIREDMLAPILGRKAEMAEAVARMQALQGANQPQPSVLEQVMATNAMAEQPAVDNMGVAQIPVPERQYAGGGIIAFDEGGDVGDLENEFIAEAREMDTGPSVQSLYAMLSRLPSRAVSAVSDKLQSFAMPKSYTAEKQNAAMKAEGQPPMEKRGGHKYEDIVIQEATRQGVDPRLAVHVLYKETGNLKDPENARSKAGALGVMQLMPGTAKELGVNPLDPMENIQGGISYLKKMYAKYQDPSLAAAAYNAGPGRVDRALRSEGGLGNLPRETRNYMVGLASGGEVKHFQYGGSTMGGFDDAYTDVGVPIVPIDEYTVDPMTGEKLFSGYGKPSKKKETAKKETPAPAPAAPVLTAQEQERFNRAPKEAERDIFAEIMADRKAEREAIKKSAAEDRNLALLAAGLGMMGGTSPYAFANIGAGGAKGIEALAASKAKRGAELSNLSTGDIRALYYSEENKRKNMAQQSLEASRAIDDLAAYEDKLRKMYFMPGVPETPKQREAFEKAKISDPLYQKLYKNVGLSSTRPVAPVLTYNPQTRSIGQ